MITVNLSNLHDALNEVDAWVDAYPADTVLALWEARAWEMLDYQSWEALCDARGWARRVALPRPERREVVATLRQEGMSTRAIAAATGVSKSTVSDDLAQLSDCGQLPETVTSLDGRTRPATQPARVFEVVEDGTDSTDSTEVVEVLTEDEWKARNVDPTPSDLDALIPADVRFQRAFWKRMVITHALVTDLDYPQYFTEEMAESLADFAETITKKLAQIDKSRRTLRAIPGGSNT